ncbi:MAG: transcription elongation factor GreA [Spirochaetales bacterium]|jgi:transcription elongation factor GreA|nr:transcription elongation factor GreA [Spirochaetales bacterium]
MAETETETTNENTERIVKKVQELLNEEKWTRAALNSYSIHNFQELDKTLEEIFRESSQEKVREVCEEHLHHTKNSIIALYISGIVSLSQQLVDDSHLVTLISIFVDNHKWGIVEFLSLRILEFGENKFALRTLADTYNTENEGGKLYDVWERLIRVDYEEADIVKSLADRKEAQGQKEEAVDYYKKALHRFINKKVFTSIREIWHKLIGYCPEETDFFYHAERKVAKTISEERAVQLLEDLYPHYKKEKNWDTAISILKRILEYDAKSPWARKEIIECCRQKYARHSQLEEYIRLSNLTQGWRSIHEALADFEKHISFDDGNFVYHREWGVGQIKSIKDDVIEIDFVKKRRHKMSLKMAVSALQILGKQHIWVLKSGMNKEKLHAKVKSDIPWALKTVIKSLDNAADMKKIKAELVPSVLSAGEWSSWSTAARRILKEDNNFGSLPDKADYFEVRSQPVSLEEKTLNRFKAEKGFFERVEIIEDYAFNMKNIEENAESFGEMLEYFSGFMRSYTSVSEYVVSSFLLVRKIVAKYPYLNPGIAMNFKPLFAQISSMEDIFQKITNADIKKELLAQIRKDCLDWQALYVKLFPHILSRHVLDELIVVNGENSLKDFFLRVINSYRENRETFVWLTRNFWTPEWYEKLGVKYEKILIAMIHLLDITSREIENRRDAGTNRKLNRQAYVYLFDEKRLEGFITKEDKEAVSRVYTLLWDLASLDDALKLNLRPLIQERFEDFKFPGKGETPVVASRGFYVASSSYEQKKKALQQLIEVDIPANSKEIGEAIALGDLRENAEYKAAKEKQELYNSQVGKLTEDLEKAQIIYAKDVDASKISFGTKTVLYNTNENTREEYTILGPWESDPARQIISYLSPLGNELLNHTTGEELAFVINEHAYNYRVEDIRVAEYQ